MEDEIKVEVHEENEESSIFCVFCSNWFTSTGSSSGGGDQFRKNLKELMEELRMSSLGDSEVSSLVNLVCPECSERVKCIVGLKEEAEMAEKIVRDLQKKILVGMRELDKCLEKYHSELKWMGRIVEESDFAGLEVENQRFTGIVGEVKGKVGAAIQDLGHFRKHLGLKINSYSQNPRLENDDKDDKHQSPPNGTFDCPSPSNSICQSNEKSVPQNSGVLLALWKEQVVQDLLKKNAKTGINGNQNNARVIEYDSDRKTLTYAGIEIKLLEEERRLGCSLCDFQTSQNPMFFVSSIRNHIDGRHANLICSKCKALFSNLNLFRKHERSCGEENYDEDKIGVITSSRPKRKRSFISKVGSNSDSDEEENEGDECDDDWQDKLQHDNLSAGSDNETDVGLRRCKRRRVSRKSKHSKTTTRSLLTTDNSLSRLPQWRREILRSMSRWRDEVELKQLWDLTKDLEEQLSSRIENFHAPQTPSDLIQYNPIEERVTFYSIPIFFNDKDHSLQCSKCDYITPPHDHRLRIHRHIFKHIHGRHLGPLYCNQCGSQHSSPRTLFTHSQRHTGKSDTICDICSKPLAKGSLEAHKLHHMNAEEKEEALRIMASKPKRKIIRRNPSQSHHQCSTCGKECQSKRHLRDHERTHIPKEERETALCPDCGKVTLKTTLYTHLKFHCVSPAGIDRPRIKCLHCDVTLKNEKELKRHIARIHSEVAKERPVKCEECNKSFKFESDLKRHLNEVHLHFDKDKKMSWACEKCGKIFFVKRYWKRHPCEYDKINPIDLLSLKLKLKSKKIKKKRSRPI